MPIPSLSLVLIASPFLWLLATAGGDPPDAAEPVPAVVLLSPGDGLRERLPLVMEIWHDAGDFLVGAGEPEVLDGLERRGRRVERLLDLGPREELLLVDLDREGMRERLDRAARVLFEKGGVALVAVPPDLETYPEGLEPGHACHSGHTAVARRPRRALPPRALAPPGGGTLAAGTPDPRIQGLVGQISRANLESETAALASNFSRNSTRANYIDAARDQIVAKLASFGYSPSLQSFSSSHGDNVLVEIPGALHPNRYVVVGAHYDSINSGGSSLSAPGADDNASGSSAVLEIARVLAGAGPFENTIRLIWFAGEEYGLLGSAANAASSRAAGQEIVAMLNTDMNAYRAPGDARDCDFVTNNTSAALTGFCDATSALYVSNWASRSGSLSAGTSDHASYTAEGFPAVFFFEDISQYSPYIHGSGDSYPQSTPDFDLALMITRGVVACTATLADPLDLLIDHTPLPDTQNASGPYQVVARVTSQIGSAVSAVELFYSGDGGQSYASQAMAQSGQDWTGWIPSQGSPVTVAYYLRASDDQGHVEVLPKGADSGAPPFRFFVGTKTPIYATDFEEATDAGWTHAQVATQDDWQRGAPAGKSGDPASAFSGSRAWGNDLGPSGWNGAYQNNVNNWLRSPAVDCSAADNVHLELRRWLTVESGQYDQAQIRVNGQVVWQNPSSGDLFDSAWTPFSLDISALAAGNPSVQVEFRLISDGGVVYGGWNIDDFALVRLGPGTTSCAQPATYCTAKINSLLCSPAISAAGTPSASVPAPFTVEVRDLINNKNGLVFYGFGRAAIPLQGGTLCVQPPIKRTAVASSGGNPPPNDCSGLHSLEFNALIQSGADPALVPGAIVRAQYWGRDPGDFAGYGTSLSDALEFTVCP